MNRRGWRCFTAVAAAAAFCACGRDEAAPAKGTPVTAERVSAHRIVEQIQATGELLAVEEASVAAEVGGRITALRVSEGAPVHAGDVVLEIDRERRELELANENAMVAAARSEIAQQRRELDRIRTLHKSEAASQAQLDAATTRVSAAEAALAAAEAKLGLARLALRNASVAAPFDGLVARRFVSAGDHVSEGEKLFDLVALDPIEVEFHLTERDSARVEVGHPVEVRVTPYPDEVFHAKVHVVSPRIDPATRTLRVKALVENPERKLRPGLFARADLGVAVRERVAMVPEQAVLQRSDGSVVFVVRDGNRAERRQVRLGVFRDGLAEVVDGVAVGEQVIVRGSSRLVDGSVIELRRSDGTAVDGLANSEAAPAVAGAPAPSRSIP
ncbi:MAG TPA: efflux RND transporter periplasmic adaptor subunit [Myxococcota bacterium]|nr:efflux RND transporter periplasmic adaptor subunit [Myxococcota bacterium]